jgi:hypothetical protein
VGGYADSYAEDDPSALTDFQGVLEPYGTWRDDPTVGWVWLPDPTAVGPGFQPYVTAGRWTYDGGWTWVSQYPWGWLPFHYGRWVWLRGLGWAWVPGRQYAGAWVDWRAGGGYVGWAPTPPRWIWRGGVAVASPYVPPPAYFFSRREDLFSGQLAPRVVTGPSYYNRTTPYVQTAPPAYRSNPRATYAGPPPSALGIPSTRVVAPPAGDPNLSRAQTYAHPSTAPRQQPPPARRVR